MAQIIIIIFLIVLTAFCFFMDSKDNSSGGYFNLPSGWGFGGLFIGFATLIVMIVFVILWIVQKISI